MFKQLNRDLIGTFKLLAYIPLLITFIPVGLIYKANKWALNKVSNFD